MPVIKYTPECKANAVIRHLQDAVPVSQICQELDVNIRLTGSAYIGAVCARRSRST